MDRAKLLELANRGVPSPEIARQLGTTASAVRGQLQRLQKDQMKATLALLTSMLCDLLDGCKGAHELIEQTGMPPERAEAIYNWWQSVTTPALVQYRPHLGDAAMAWVGDGRFDMKCIAISDIDAQALHMAEAASKIPAENEPAHSNWKANAELLRMASAVLKELTPGIDDEG